MSREQRDSLLHELLPMARELLERKGEFFPFAGAIAPNGETKLIAGTASSQRPETRAIVEVLAAGLASGVRAGDYLVTAICFTTSDPRLGEVICIEFEDGDDEPAAMMVPYTKTRKLVDFGEASFARCTSRVFHRTQGRIQP